MEKQNYTHAQTLISEVRNVLSGVKTHGKTVKYYGVNDKRAVNQPLIWELGQKLLFLKDLCHIRRIRFDIFRWKISCCEIFAIHRKKVRPRVRRYIIYRHR